MSERGRDLAGRLGALALAAVPLAVLAVFFVLPVAGMVSRGLVVHGQVDLVGIARVLGRARVHRVLWFTLWSAGLGTLLTVVLGLPVAYVLHRLRFPGRAVLRGFVVVPFVLPTVVVGVAFRQLLASSGPLGFLGIDGTATAVVAALVFFNVSVVVRTVGSMWEGLDRRREEAAAVLGASPWQVMRTVTLPALLPAVVSAASVVFLFCATAFGVVLTLGGLRYANVETEIYLLTTQFLDLRSAAALSLLQVAVVTVLLVAAHRTRRRREQSVARTAASSGRRPGRSDAAALAATGVVLMALAAPLLTLLVGSLRVDGAWSWRNYRLLTTTGGGNALVVPVTTALRNSLAIAVDATLLAVSLGLVVSVVVSRPVRGPGRGPGRGRGRGRGLIDGIVMLPLGVSAVTLGFGFLITLDQPPLDLRTSPVLIPIAQAMVALPLVVRTVAPVLRSVDPRQREVAASLGAPPWRVLSSVDLPLVWRPVLAAVGFAFAVSLGEFGATSFLARPDYPTLPVVIYRLISRPGAENFGMALAASVVLALATSLVMMSVERLRVGSMGAF